MPEAASSFYTQRSAALSEALQALLTAAVAAATDKGSGQLSVNAARFDGTAAALEQDLITLARASKARPQPLPVQLLRTLADHEEAAARSAR